MGRGCATHGLAGCPICDRGRVAAYLSDPQTSGCDTVTPPTYRGDWMQTFTGRQYWPLRPDPADVNIEDIAHHLGMLCRFTGACRRFYSVAEHSVHASHLLERYGGRQWKMLARWGLLHDAHEAYINDMNRPTKRSVVGYDEIDARNWEAVRVALNIETPDGFKGWVKDADNAMLVAEQAALMAPAPEAWQPVDVPEYMRARAHELIEAVTPWGWGPDRAKWEFMQRYRVLTE